MRPIQARLLAGGELYREVVLEKLARARESVWIATANVKAMYVRQGERHVPLLQVLDGLAARGVALRLLHAELPSRPFRAEFDRRARLVRGGLELKVCPRVHFKTVLVDGAWAYLGSANLTGAGLGAKGEDVRNFELGLVTEDFDVIDRVTALYESVWGGASCRGCRLRAVCPDPILPAGTPEPRGRAASARLAGGPRLGRARRLERGRG